jgi:hypothetical protein
MRIDVITRHYKWRCDTCDLTRNTKTPDTPRGWKTVQSTGQPGVFRDYCGTCARLQKTARP